MCDHGQAVSKTAQEADRPSPHCGRSSSYLSRRAKRDSTEFAPYGWSHESHSPVKNARCRKWDTPCFPPVVGQTIRADFEGGALSSDFGALLLRGVDRQLGRTARLAAAMHEKRHQSSIDHPLRDLLAQRISQIASGYVDGNDAKSLRRDPLFTRSVERSPLDAEPD